MRGMGYLVNGNIHGIKQLISEPRDNIVAVYWISVRWLQYINMKFYTHDTKTLFN